MIDYSQYKEFATDRQLEHLDALSKNGTQAKAAKALGINKRTLEKSLRRLREKAASMGFDPACGVNKRSPEGYEVSTYRVDAKGQYVPAFAKKKEDNYIALSESMIEVMNNYKKPKATKTPKKVEDDLLNLYTISDGHLGMLSWGRETGSNWNLEKAEQTIFSAFAESIERSPNATTCYINQLGDFLHTDGLAPVTPLSGHVLDTDTRYYKLVQTAATLLRKMVDLALSKHKKVYLLCAEGNHDLSAPPWLHTMFSMIYENEPRLEVIEGPRPYYAFEWGKNMLAFHHGHKINKASGLVRFFSSDPEFRPLWGRAKYAYCHTGHLHHERVEDGGMLVTQHPTLAGRSSYEARGGWSSPRACMTFTYSKQFGEVSCNYVKPNMLGDLGE